ncbi:hypothetical protein MAR_006730 [Mya arenaria]|uniref:Uncharacterized protein n=1 Tax=Mya arenaria TaxID=6604 RepID=A0ABY7D9D4_MYAAR|nr:hypothetical protein MAR_006730 [Mya arenaria]
MVELCMYFCRRGQENQRDLTVDMFHIMADETDDREYVAQRVSEVTKSHQGTSKEILGKDVRISFKLYINKKNPECSAFFQTPRDSFLSSDVVWFENKYVGKTYLGKMMFEFSESANLSREYTNHCIRATAITALSHAGFEARHIMTISGHRNESSVRSSVKDTTPQQKRVMSETLSNILPHSICSVFDDGMNDALCLSASQTERILEDITHYENFSGACASNAETNKRNEIETLRRKM